MDQMRDAVFRYRAVQGAQLGYVALNEVGAAELFFGEQGPKAVRVSVQVKDTRSIATLNQILHNPGPNESLGASDKKARLRCGSARLWSLRIHARALYVGNGSVVSSQLLHATGRIHRWR